MAYKQVASPGSHSMLLREREGKKGGSRLYGLTTQKMIYGVKESWCRIPSLVVKTLSTLPNTGAGFNPGWEPWCIPIQHNKTRCSPRRLIESWEAKGVWTSTNGTKSVYSLQHKQLNKFLDVARLFISSTPGKPAFLQLAGSWLAAGRGMVEKKRKERALLQPCPNHTTVLLNGRHPLARELHSLN